MLSLSKMPEALRGAADFPGYLVRTVNRDSIHRAGL
jgi:hypothetical protein